VLARRKPSRRPGGAAQGDGGPISAQEIRDRLDRASRNMVREHRHYWVNRSFVAGEQHIWWDAQRRRPDTLPRTSDEHRLTINRLRPNTRILMAKLMRRPLVFEVSPSAADDAAVIGARKARAAVADVAREHRWEDMRRDLCWNTWQGGTGGLCIEWDPRAGTPLGQSERTGKPYGTGDSREYALDVTEIAVEPGVRDAERARWWIRIAALPPGEVQDLYGLEEPPAADASAMLSPLQRTLMAADRGEVAAGELALVLTYYERPSSTSQGQVAVVVGEAIVDGPHPWPFPFTDRLNLVVAREIPVAGRWCGDTVLSDAISPQRALNRAETSIDEHMDKAGNARGMYEEGTIEEEALDDDPATWVAVRPGSQRWPDYMSPPAMPAWWAQRADQCRAAIDDIMGVHNISRGDQDGSGRALALLAEQDDTPLGALAKEMAEAWGRFATLWLELAQARVTEPRRARIDRGDVPETATWTGDDFAGQTTAHVPLEAVQPRSRLASFEMAKELKRVYPDMPLRVFTALADIPGSDDVTEALDPDIARARRENHQMAAGVPALPERWDNHVLHIEELNRFRKSAAYDDLDEPRQELFDLHATAHEVMAAEEMGAQVAKAAVSPALAAAAQAGEPPLAGEPPALPVPGVNDQAPADPGAPTAPVA